MLGHGVRVAAGHLADNHATAGAFADVNMVVARRPHGDQLKFRMRVEECRIDPGGDVDAENVASASTSTSPVRNRRSCSASAASKKSLSGCSVSVNSTFMASVPSTAKRAAQPSCVPASRYSATLDDCVRARSTTRATSTSRTHRACKRGPARQT
jgi:hypothetical protein